MKIEQGYGTLQDDVTLSGYTKELQVDTRQFTKGHRFYVLVEQIDNKISSSLKCESGFSTRISGNVFTKDVGIRVKR